MHRGLALLGLPLGGLAVDLTGGSNLLIFFFGSPLTHSNPFHSGLTSSAFILAGLLLLASSLLHLLSWILLYRRRIPSPNSEPQSQFSVPILKSGP